MKSLIVIFAIALSTTAGAAIADGQRTSPLLSLETLSDAQLDALTRVLGGLPRQ